MDIMTLTLCATLMQAVLLVSAGDAPDTYAEAHRQTTETGKPLVVMVSTDWCGPCQTMKRTILPRLRERGMFKKVAFAQVNADKDSELAKELTGGGPVPQLVMYRRTNHGWLRRKLIGSQSEETVEQFINEGIALDKSDHKDDSTTPDDDSNTPSSTTAKIPEDSPTSSDTHTG
jgi:thioredoxin-like negative regulator of GroEL